jgi:class 3 adenylate cyclase
MLSYTKGKNAFFRFLVSFFAASGVTIGVYVLLDGPKLGGLFDFLVSKQQESPVAPEILIIETAGTDTLMDPSTAAQVIMTIAEMGAGGLLIQTPILGVSASVNDREAELLDLFNREFDQLGRNIQNLFEGIRMGTVPPAETGRFVDAVLSFAEEGKQRLINEAVHRSNAGTLELERAKTVFPNTWIADDHSVELARQRSVSSFRPNSPASPLLYSHATLDPDGAFRRVVPFEMGDAPNYEHIVYYALKNRFGSAVTAANPAGQYLIMEKIPGFASAGDRFFTLDKDGAILLKTPQKGQWFRRIPLADLIEYEKLDRALYKMLSESTDIGLYANVSAEKYPSYLWEQERELRNGLTANETTNKAAGGSLTYAWIDARNRYVTALDTFFYKNSVENNLVGSFFSLLQNETLTDAGKERLVTMRDDLLAAFRSGRDLYNRFAEIRAGLDQEIPDSLCILGAASVDTLASATLANAIILGSAITPASARYILFWALCAVFLCAFMLRVFSPLLTLVVGIIFSAAVLAGFSYHVVATSVWIDPLIPLCGTVSGVFVSALCSLVMKRRLTRKFQIAYGPSVAKSYLTRLIRAGHPRPEDRVMIRAAIVAVKNPVLNLVESGKTAEIAASAIINFRDEVKKMFLKSGAVIAGVHGDTTLAVFGSPAERVALHTMNNEMPYDDDAKPRGAHNPVTKAVGFLSELIDTNQEAGKWHFGIDYGECAFAWTALSGYAVFGPPSYNARLLAANGSRQKVRVSVSKSCVAKIDGALTRKHTRAIGGNANAEFYELITKKAAPSF